MKGYVCSTSIFQTPYPLPLGAQFSTSFTALYSTNFIASLSSLLSRCPFSLSLFHPTSVSLSFRCCWVRVCVCVCSSISLSRLTNEYRRLRGFWFFAWIVFILVGSWFGLANLKPLYLAWTNSAAHSYWWAIPAISELKLLPK